MVLTGKEYKLCLKKCNCIFDKVIEAFLGNEYFCKKILLHSFAIRFTNEEENIYFDGGVPKGKVLHRNPVDSFECFIQKYLGGKKEECGNHFVLKSSKIYEWDRCFGRIYWVFSFGYLDGSYAPLLLDHIFNELADRFTQYLERNESCMDNSFNEAQEIIRYIETKFGQNLQKMFAPFNINLVNGISSEYYEKSECNSNMIFLPQGIEAKLESDDWRYRFEDIDFIPSENRLVRKLLQITHDKLYLVLAVGDNKEVYKVIGICNKETLDEKLIDSKGVAIPCVRVEIKRHMQWDMFLNEMYIMTCKNGHYKIHLPLKLPLLEPFLSDELTGYFGKRKDKYRLLCESIMKSTEQEHGTMLVIMETNTARAEAGRLGRYKYGLPAYKCHAQVDDINCLNAIDGCVIMGTNGTIYGIGMILDGMSESLGNLSRGARYNSAVKYCDSLRHRTSPGGKPPKGMILIVSEDGSVDILSVPISA